MEAVAVYSAPLSVGESWELQSFESIIERGLSTFVDVGTALARIRDGRLYRATHATFEDYLRERWQLSRPRAYQLIAAADVHAQLSTVVNNPPANEAQARVLASVPTEQRVQVWNMATGGTGTASASTIEQAKRELLPPAEVPSVPPVVTPAPDKHAVHYSSESPEWYTPPEIIAPVLAFFDEIDLDPCSNSHTNPNVPACERFTKEDDGLRQQWHGRVFLNPPGWDSGIIHPCQCDCHKLTPSDAQSAGATFRLLRTISLLDEIDLLVSPPDARNVSASMTGNADQRGGIRRSQNARLARAAALSIQQRRIFSRHSNANAVGFNRGVTDVSVPTRGPSRQHDVRTQSSTKNSWQRNDDTASQPRVANESGHSPRPITTSDGNETLHSPGNGHQRIGSDVRLPGNTDALTVEQTESLLRTISSRLATPHAPEPSQPISSPHASSVTVQSRTEIPTNGAQTPTSSAVSVDTFCVCDACAQDAVLTYPTTVFLNPPYARGIIDLWIEKLLVEYQARRVEQAIALVPARTETEWFSGLYRFPLLFISGRLHFLSPDGEKSAAPFPSVLALIGDDVDGFARWFGHLGPIVREYRV